MHFWNRYQSNFIANELYNLQIESIDSFTYVKCSAFTSKFTGKNCFNMAPLNYFIQSGIEE